MKKLHGLIILFIVIVTLVQSSSVFADNGNKTILDSHEQLIDFFQTWRDFERPPLVDGAPDYRQGTFEKRWPEFVVLHDKLLAFDTAGWPTKHKVDWTIIWAEMNCFSPSSYIQ